jgi:hypothetical protein
MQRFQTELRKRLLSHCARHGQIDVIAHKGQPMTPRHVELIKMHNAGLIRYLRSTTTSDHTIHSFAFVRNGSLEF